MCATLVALTLGSGTDLCPQLKSYLRGTRRHEARMSSPSIATADCLGLSLGQDNLSAVP